MTRVPFQSKAPRALLDTSIIVGGRDVLAGVPAISSLSAITIGELRAGVALAATTDEKRRRSVRLEAVRAAFAPVPSPALQDERRKPPIFSSPQRRRLPTRRW